jgi:hypothetical protein
MGSSPEAFQLLQFTFNGKPLAGRRTARAMSQVLPINLEEADGRCPPASHALLPHVGTAERHLLKLGRRHPDLEKYFLGIGFPRRRLCTEHPPTRQKRINAPLWREEKPKRFRCY